MVNEDPPGKPEPLHKGLRFKAGIEFGADDETLEHIDVLLQRASTLIRELMTLVWRVRYILVLVVILVKLLVLVSG